MSGKRARITPSKLKKNVTTPVHCFSISEGAEPNLLKFQIWPCSTRNLDRYQNLTSWERRDDSRLIADPFYADLPESKGRFSTSTFSVVEEVEIAEKRDQWECSLCVWYSKWWMSLRFDFPQRLVDGGESFFFLIANETWSGFIGCSSCPNWAPSRSRISNE